MRLLRVIIATLLLLQISVTYALPTAEQAGNAAIGGALGGLLGNQVGNGRGKTIATAAGAATGVVIASGCKITYGTALGGMLGGLLGSQVGGGNGSNLMAGVGAGVGALLGSDCQPGAEPVAVAPLPNMPPFEINGLRLTPVNGFPQEAFYGIPPIVTPEDLFAAAKMVRRLTDISLEARAKDNPELSVLSMYWAKRISTTSLAILSASLESIRTNTGTSAKIPSKGLVILPAFNNFRDKEDAGHRVLLDAVHEMFAANEYATSKGVMVADASGFDSVKGLLGALTGQQQQQVAPPAPSAAPPDVFAGIPLNTALRLDDGQIVLKTDGALTVYNPNPVASILDLDKLDYIPRTPPLSPARQAAAEMMFTLNASEAYWAFNEYAYKTKGGFNINIKAPNTLIDRDRGSVVVARFNGSGVVDNYEHSTGARAYRSNPDFRRAVNILEAVEVSSPLKKHAASCRAANMGNAFTLNGKHAELANATCFAPGRYKEVTYVRTFIIGDVGEQMVVQDKQSLMQDIKNQDAMTRALANGKAFSDATAFVPGYGNIEGGLACLGDYTIGQQGAIAAALLKSGDVETDAAAKDKLIRLQSPGHNKNLALMSGWTPPATDEWDFNRIVNCVTAIPLVGYAGSMVNLADQIALRAGGHVLSGLTEKRITVLRDITDAFATPVFFKKYMKDIGNVQTLFPENIASAAFVKTIYDGLMHSQNMGQTVDGFSSFKY